MSASKIEWTNETWNPVTGCSRVSPGCDNCYALRRARMLEHNPNAKIAERYRGSTWKFTNGLIDWTGKARYHEDLLYLPLHWKKPRRVFVCSMSDLFHPDVPFEFIQELFGVIGLCPQHTFQILTKRPERMLEFYNRSMDGISWHLPRRAYEHLPNLWLGVTAENQETADERIPLLLKTPAAVRFVSVEPMLGPVDLSYNGLGIPCPTCKGQGEISDPKHWMHPKQTGDEPDENWCLDCDRIALGIHWVICGGESGPGARPMAPAWARNLREQCNDAGGVPFFMKQMGGVRDKRAKVSDLPEDLRIREYPEVTERKKTRNATDGCEKI